MSPDEVETPVTRVPAAWRAGFLVQQITVLLIAGPLLLMATWGAPVADALWSQLPDPVVPPGLVIPVAVAAPLLLPLALGLPLALTRHRAPLLLWLALMLLVCGIAVIEVSRLNWVAFVSGIAFRIESGPVPLVRTLGGLGVLLSGLALLAHQSIHLSIHHLAERGIEPGELARTRSGLLGLERTVLLGAGAAGGVLTLVAAVSMSATEGAPDPGGRILVPLIWTAVLLALLLVAWLLAARRRAAGPPAVPFSPDGRPELQGGRHGRGRMRRNGSPSQRS